ncbi:MAG: sigma-70 family RNA polymerase sigma factor [Acidobacteria bacterium]|nr:sigma-70 family RNA polymerase sigma factor [Acidobacteriota bacterium]
MSDPRVTELLLDWSHGKRDALDRLLPMVETSLHDIARNHLRRERPDHSLEPSALVNELYLALVDQQKVSWRDRAHFFAVAAHMMRRILVDHARKRQADKRGGEFTRVTLTESLGVIENERLDVVVLDEAMTRLETIFPQQSRVVELRFFAGLTIEETAESLDISPATVKREWTMAKAWLRRAVGEPSAVRRNA